MDTTGSASEGSGRRSLTVGWFGTSIMEHWEAVNTRMTDQSNLPPVGTGVIVESWRHRGYPYRLQLALQAAWPDVSIVFDNQAAGGATSRDVLRIAAQAANRHYDLAVLSCGLNDVWRTFQNRTSEAVDIEEFTGNYTAAFTHLTSCSSTVICLSETPFGPVADSPTVAAMNRELMRYNRIAAREAACAGVLVLDVWDDFTRAARLLAAGPAGSVDSRLWSDGVHLSDLGDALVLRQLESFLSRHRIVERLVE
ncbi:SGNH/GDSL hydrolase family protein [Streptomyces sp. RKAG337]|uniref:SGNH/GDSL hydrolase family protein n=1 Tax=Streptomyces sp. RKAG337 TaxID=2893404 RepID=UPI002033AE6E|nr:GDSL-type esterase/lipase family protein [Streptomyces sp. RKAG337]MCM2430974.1 GDSL-type esterase/lipase family protein [Streptomyces sp. RKAG337]